MKRQLRKKVTGMVAWSLTAVMLIGIRSAAAEPVEFHVENQKGKAGNVVTVPVELTSGEEIGGFEIVVYYDSDCMEFDKLRRGKLVQDAEDGLFDYNAEYGDGAVKIVFVVADMVKADGVIADISFKLKKDCGESLPIGVGVDKVLDGGEESRELEAAVTGTDEAVQASVEQRKAEVEEQRKARAEQAEGRAETDTEDENNEEDVQEDVISEINGEKQENVKPEKSNETDKTGKQERQNTDSTKQEHKSAAAGMVVFLVAAAGMAAAMIFKGKRK